MTEGTSVEDDRKESLELADPAHFHEVTFVVEHLRVGLAHLVGKRDLGAEPEHCNRAVEQRGLQDAGLVLAGSGIIGDERNPPALVIRPSELAAESYCKAPRQCHVRAQPRPVPGAVPAAPLRILLHIADQAGDLHGREEHVGRAQGKHHDRSREALVLLIFPIHPSRPAARPQAREDHVLHFQACAEIIVEGGAAEPALAHGGQQAHFGSPAEQPARPHVAGHERLVEQAPLILPVVDVEPRTQPPAVGQGILVFSAAPPHHTDIGTGLGLHAPAERKTADIDELGVRGGVDIGIRRQGRSRNTRASDAGPA